MGPARVLGAVAAASAGVLLIGVLWSHRATVAAGDDENVVVRVGVAQGQSVPGYLLSSRTELATLGGPSAPATGDMWALVSLDDYRPPRALAALLAGTTVAQVYVRVPLLGTRTPVLRLAARLLPGDVLADDVMAGMRGAAVGKDQEAAGLRRLAREAGAGQRAREAYESTARTASAEAAAYRSGCACVFAAVVRAAPVALRAVADRAGIRVVDPAPEVRRMDRTEFRPPRPEQRGIVPDEPAAGGSVPNRSTPEFAVRSASTDISRTGPLAPDPTSEEGSGSSPPAPVREATIGPPATP